LITSTGLTSTTVPYRTGISVCEKNSQTLLMNSSWTVCKTVCDSQSVTDFGKHCSWTVYERFAKQFVKASQSPTLANTVHDQFMNSLQNSLRKPVSHRLLQTCSWTVCKHMFAKSGKKIGRNSGTRIFCFTYFIISIWKITLLEV
jgi:hypothetical protein